MNSTETKRARRGKISEKKTLDKKEQILASAINIINQRGYAGATMEEIAAALQMTKGSLYYYFKNKSDLMYQCHIYVLAKGKKELDNVLEGEGTAEEILRKMIANHIDYVIDEKETNNLLIKPRNFFEGDQVETVIKFRKLYSNPFDRVIERGINSGEFTVEDPAFARMMILGATNWTQQWYRPDGKMTKDEIKQKFGDYIMKLLK